MKSSAFVALGRVNVWASSVDTPGDNQSAHLPLPSLLVGLLSARPNCDKLTDEGLLSQIRDIIQLLLEPAGWYK